jgi:hypothetical protein
MSTPATRPRIGWSRGLAGVLGGLPVAFGGGLLLGIGGNPLGVVLGVLTVLPLWVTIMLAAWLAPKAWQAWLGVGLAAAVIAALWRILR